MLKQRVSRACDTCKRRKIRCTGKLPCAHCIKNNKTCEFKAAYTRGVAPEVQSAPVEEQEKYLEEVGYKRRQIWRGSSTVKNSSHVAPLRRDEVDKEEGDEDVERSPINHNKSTVYQRLTSVDNLAGACLYERTQHNMNRQGSNQKNPVNAYGDPPLPEIDTSFLVVPPERTAKALVGKYFDFVAATNRFLHQPTIDAWTSQLLNSVKSMRPGVEVNSKRAVVLMVFASAHEYMDEFRDESDSDTSFYYFQAADDQLSKETGRLRLATLQARLLQCMYLLSRSRINQCYSIFGTLVNYIYALGIHRQGGPSRKSDVLEIEIRKRIFWSAYVTDKYLSSALGRPQLLRDEDTDQQLPLLVEDENLSSSSVQAMGLDTQTPMKGSVFQTRLAQIISNILHELYGIQKISLESRLASAGRLNEELLKWRGGVAHFVSLDPSLLSPMYSRQNMALRLSYLQARIILYRPFLVECFGADPDMDIPVVREKLEQQVTGCLDAALDVVDIIDAMSKMESSFKASWVSDWLSVLSSVFHSLIIPVCTFLCYTATVAIFVHIIKRCTVVTQALSDPINPYNEKFCTSLKLYYDAATKCQELIKNSSIETKESFARKCSIVLEELRADAAIQMKQLQKKYTNELGRNKQVNPEVEQESHGGAEVQMEYPGFFEGEWNDLDFEQTVGGDGMYSLFHGLDGYRDSKESGSLVDRIDRWGFSSLTGY